MNPTIPLSPQQKRRRRKNILFVSLCSCAALGALGYLYYPEEGLENFVNELLSKPPFSSDETAEGNTDSAATTDSSNAAPAGSNAAPAASTTPGALHTGTGTQPTTAPNATHSTSGSTAAPAAPTATTNATTSAEAGTTPSQSNAAQGNTAPGEATPNGEQATQNETGFTDEELAQLPAWQQGFVRLNQQQRVEFAAIFTKAKAAYNAEQWTSCLALLSNCDHIYDGSPNVWNLRACALLAINELNDAEHNINRSLQLNPHDSVALMCLSELRMLRQDYRGSIEVLQKLRDMHRAENDPALHDAFTFHQLLCHLMLRQEMEARALVAGLSPICDTPLYYYAEAAFCVYRGDGTAALEPLRSVTNIFGNGGATSSYRKWMSKCGLADKYVRKIRR